MDSHSKLITVKKLDFPDISSSSEEGNMGLLSAVPMIAGKVDLDENRRG